MEDCPTIQDLAAFVEGSPTSQEIREHAGTCPACKASLDALSGEIQTLQISISQLWFQDRISCCDEGTLERYKQGKLPADLSAYITFHLEELQCPFCQAWLGEQEINADQGETRRRRRSREKVGEATSVFLKQLRDGR